MMLHFLLHKLYYVAGILVFCLSKYIEHMVIAKLVLIDVFGFIQSVGINEEGTPLDRFYFLTDKL
jgi:hypothetical protein